MRTLLGVDSARPRRAVFEGHCPDDRPPVKDLNRKHAIVDLLWLAWPVHPVAIQTTAAHFLWKKRTFTVITSPSLRYPNGCLRTALHAAGGAPKPVLWDAGAHRYFMVVAGSDWSLRPERSMHRGGVRVHSHPSAKTHSAGRAADQNRKSRPPGVHL